MIREFPHSDHKVLHAPGECDACDTYPEWQELRRVWGIAYTGRTPGSPESLLPCPSDFQAWQGVHPRVLPSTWVRQHFHIGQLR